MDMVKVDPKLFITCRLCLEDMGTYQITPVAREQIKFCFDIEVNQFDGLPQLICEKCEKILSEYFTRKRVFVGRQNALLAKLEVRKEVEDSLCPSPPHEAVSSSQQNDNEAIPPNKKPSSRPKKRKIRIISSNSSANNSRDASASPACSNENSYCNSKTTHEKKRIKTRRESWEEKYTKKFACKLCNKYLKFGAGITNHVKTHARLLTKYQNIIKRPCSVQLTKIDDKPNCTGNSNTVVLSHKKILGPQKEYVYILYISNRGKNTPDYTEFGKSDITYVDSDDTDEVIGKGTHVKRRRISSKSSIDTVILNDDSRNPVTSDVQNDSNNVGLQTLNQENEVIECINIDESSNGSHQSDCMSIKDNAIFPVKNKDVEAIKNLIRVCHNKYISKRQETLETDTKIVATKDPQLKHKLLSMGRKVINRQGLACTGLLRFMENKNLVIKWTPMMVANKETTYVRIMPRLKSRDELAPEKNLGWKKRPEVQDSAYVEILTKPDDTTSETTNSDSSKNCVLKNQTSDECAPKTKDVILETNGTEESESKLISSELIDIASTSTCTAVDNAPLVSTSKIIASFEENNAQLEVVLFQDTKLLNANPVANPKQLPKKSVIPDSKLHTQSLHETAVSQNYPQSDADKNNHNLFIDLNGHQLVSNDIFMPIITSTTSLADSVTNNTENVPTVTDSNSDKNPTSTTETTEETEKPAPRIKVKPFSELMSDRVLKNLGHHQTVPGNMCFSMSTSNTVPTTRDMINITQVTSGGVPVNTAKVISATNSDALTTTHSSRSYIILDTVELPNTKTESPIKYFRNLLQIHNIILLESHNALPSTATCLIKFKLQFLRDAVNQPVTLCLSVHCMSNMFALGVRDPNQVMYIDLHVLSANWQWEILKIYTIRQDVINKMLQNAQKVSQETYDYTKSFLCLLKSINKKDEVC